MKWREQEKLTKAELNLLEEERLTDDVTTFSVFFFPFSRRRRLPDSNL
jgi:hypothetical protein